MNELIFVESKAAREEFVDRTDVLDKVKALVTLPDDMHITVQMAADYFKVSKGAVTSLVFDHKREIESDGMRILRGKELSSLKESSLIDKRTPSLAILPRRAVLRIAMLLRDSEVARQVRTYLLDTELSSHKQESGNDPFEVMKVVGFHVKTWTNLLDQTKASAETKGAVLKAIYEYAGMILPIEFAGTKQQAKQVDDGNWYSCKRIAELADAYSITKKPHVQLISALIRKLGVTPGEYKFLSDPFANGKEEVMMYLYKPSVVQKVTKALDDLNRPTALKVDHVYNIVYMKHITDTKFAEM